MTFREKKETGLFEREPTDLEKFEAEKKKENHKISVKDCRKNRKVKSCLECLRYNECGVD